MEVGMIEVVPVDDERVVAWRVQGSIGPDDVDRVASAIAEKETQTAKGDLRALVEVDKLGRISPNALKNYVKAVPKHFRSFGKKAVVADLGFFNALVGPADRLFAQLQIKHFPKGEREAALSWLKS